MRTTQKGSTMAERQETAIAQTARVTLADSCETITLNNTSTSSVLHANTLTTPILDNSGGSTAVDHGFQGQILVVSAGNHIQPLVQPNLASSAPVAAFVASSTDVLSNSIVPQIDSLGFTTVNNSVANPLDDAVSTSTTSTNLVAPNRVALLADGAALSMDASSSFCDSISGRNADEDVKDDEDEELDVDAIIEVSPNERYRKRNQRCPRHTPGVDAAFYAFDQRVGKEVIWNEVFHVRPEQEAELLRILKKFKKANHPYIIRILDFWRSTCNSDSAVKFVIITERLEEGTLKQFMSNSSGTRSLKMWRKYTGNLLSVLRFFAEVGLTHGNLTNDTIHHQKNGTLKVGTFALDDVLYPNATRDMTKFVKTRHYFAPEYYDESKNITAASDIYAAGVLSLEIAVLDPKYEEVQLEPKHRIKEMMNRLVNSEQRDFIRSCLAKEPQSRASLEALCNHSAMIEVPRLALLAGNKLVSFGSLDQIQKLLDPILERLEDDLVVATVVKNSSLKSKDWKEVAPNNVLSLKYLEEIKSGFHPLFGCVNKVADTRLTSTVVNLSATTLQQSDIGSLSGSSSVRPKSPPVNAANRSDVLLVEDKRKITSAEFYVPGTTGSSPVMAHHLVADAGCVNGNVPLSSTIIDNSLSCVAKEILQQPAVPLIISAVKPALSSVAAAAVGNLATSGGISVNVPTSAAASTICTATDALDEIESSVQLPVKGEVENEEEDYDDDDEDNLDQAPEAKDTFQRPKDTAKTPPGRVVSCYIYYIGLGRWNVHLAVYFEDNRCMRQCTTQALEQDYWRHRKIARTFQEMGAICMEDLEEVAQRLYFALRGHPTINGLYHNLDILARKQGWEIPVDLVLPTDNTLNYRDLLGRFTERDISVDPGTANFQIHNLMDKLQRLQQERIAERALEEPRLFPSVPADALSRDKANHCLANSVLNVPPLDNGEMNDVDGFQNAAITCSTSEDLLSASSWNPLLTSVHECAGGGLPESLPVEHTSVESGWCKRNTIEQTIEFGNQESEELDMDNYVEYEDEEEGLTDGQTSISLNMSSIDPSAGSSNPMSRSVSGQPPAAASVEETSSSLAIGDHHDVRLDSCHNSKSDDCYPPDIITWGCGGSCQRYRLCRYCDRSDYLMRSELEPYLTHPCYHCRAALSKDAGLTKTELWYAHIEYGIPWPFFLSCLLGPPLEDAQMEAPMPLEEMIEYECRHRARRPCRCLKDKQGKVRVLPPCQEFPEDYWTEDENTEPSLDPSCPTAMCPFNPINRKTVATTALTSSVSSRQRRRRSRRSHIGEEIVNLNAMPLTTGTDLSGEGSAAEAVPEARMMDISNQYIEHSNNLSMLINSI